MRTAAIVCEYNPFHNGHQYQIEETRRRLETDYIIAIMSGNYVQRGEPALLDKWARTEMALAGGADLVLEIPSVYSASSAQYFAAAAIDLANKTGVVDFLSFGSDTADQESLSQIAGSHETEAYRQALRSALRQGLSYPAAATAAGQSGHHVKTKLPPNDILAVEYLSALQRSGSAIKPFPVKRSGASHHDRELHRHTASGSAIRLRMEHDSRNLSILRHVMPDDARSILYREINGGRGPVFLQRYETILFAAIRSGGPGALAKLPFVSEGLEHRLYEMACRYTSLEELLCHSTTARYPTARIRRILTTLLTGATAGQITDKPDLPYLRILGMRRSAAPLVKRLRQKAQVPLVAQCGRDQRQLSPAGKQLLEQERRATDIYVLGFPCSAQRIGGQEFTRPFVTDSAIQ